MVVHEKLTIDPDKYRIIIYILTDLVLSLYPQRAYINTSDTRGCKRGFSLFYPRVRNKVR